MEIKKISYHYLIRKEKKKKKKIKIYNNIINTKKKYIFLYFKIFLKL